MIGGFISEWNSSSKFGSSGRHSLWSRAESRSSSFEGHSTLAGLLYSSLFQTRSFASQISWLCFKLFG
jgi:hypothetical protein